MSSQSENDTDHDAGASRGSVADAGLAGAPRLLLLGSGVAFLVLTTSWTVLQILAQAHAGHGLRAVLIACGAGLVLGAWLRVISVNWRAARTQVGLPPMPADAEEPTGIWGVGGPSMREPGNTGTWKQRDVDRRYDDGQD